MGRSGGAARLVVRLLRRRVQVAESATEISGKIVAGSPKSHRERSVILPRFIVDRLSEHLARGSPQSAESPDRGRLSEGLVFSAPRGGFLRVSNFRRSVWLPAVEAAGIEPGLRVHDLRHTAASLMISAGASIKAVQTALGHSSATIKSQKTPSKRAQTQADQADQSWPRYGTAPRRTRQGFAIGLKGSGTIPRWTNSRS